MARGRRALMAGALAVLVAGGVAVWARALGGSGSADFGGGVSMVCVAEGCGHAFGATVEEIGAARRRDPDAPLPCPACGGPSERAARCGACEGSYPLERARRGAPCPLCGAEPAPVSGRDGAGG